MMDDGRASERSSLVMPSQHNRPVPATLLPARHLPPTLPALLPPSIAG